MCIFLIQPQPDHGVYTVFVELGDTKIEVRILAFTETDKIHVIYSTSILKSEPISVVLLFTDEFKIVKTFCQAYVPREGHTLNMNIFILL